jgi:hypothetical protein
MPHVISTCLVALDKSHKNLSRKKHDVGWSFGTRCMIKKCNCMRCFIVDKDVSMRQQSVEQFKVKLG